MDIETQIDLEIRMRNEVQQLLADLESGKEGAAPPESLDGTIGRLSRQDSLMQQEIAKDAQRRRNQRISLLHQALKRMDDGSYGLCLHCAGEIEESRLLETPETPLCFRCA